MDVSDFLCHICLGILIEPVTMPCTHRICQSCLLRSIEVNRTCCPLCKRRLGVWCRRNSPKGLVDVKLWEEIKRRFPSHVEARLSETDEVGDADALEELFPCVPTHDHASEGQVGEEFRREQERLRAEDEDRRKKEEELSEELIRRIQQEEERQENVPPPPPPPRHPPKLQPSVPLPKRREKRKREEEGAEDGRGGDGDGDEEVSGEAEPGPSCSSMEVQDQRQALEVIRQLQADEALARRLQEEEEKQERRSHVVSTPPAAARLPKKAKSARKEPGRKVMRQLSISDFSHLSKK